jgi:phosphatidylethanolamine/phosphatidyl-N-methylethanolamine N-methyltransferase
MISWDRIRYSVWAPIYDRLVARMDFGPARRRSIEALALAPGDRVLIVGAGTGLDLEYVPAGASVVAIDITPAMLARLERRAASRAGRTDARVMDARRLEYADASFDAVIAHLVIAVMPEPERGVREIDRVLKPGGRVAIFDKFLREGEAATPVRRLVNLIARPLFSDMNRRLEPLLAGTALRIERDEPAGFGGWYRVIALRKVDTRPRL